jgi:hypothetical protein
MIPNGNTSSCCARKFELAQRNYAAAAAAADADAAVQRARLDAIEPNSSAWVGEALIARARSELALGNRAAAVASAREALPQLEANLDASHRLVGEAKSLAAYSNTTRGK